MRRILRTASQFLREVERIAAAAAVGDAHVQQPEIGGTGEASGLKLYGRRYGWQTAARSGASRAGGPPFIGARRGFFPRSFEQDRLVLLVVPRRARIRLRGGISGVGQGVQLAEAGRSGAYRMRMDGEPL